MRNANIDFLRVLAALGVVVIHTSGDMPWPTVLSGSLVDSMRWCVPFFFIVSGYYLGMNEGRDKKLKTILRPVQVYLIACLVYVPYFIYFGLYQRLGAAVLLLGTSYHLWYLSALPLAYVAIYASRPDRRHLETGLASSLILVAFVAVSYVNASGHVEMGPIEAILRHMSSISFLWIGWSLRGSRLEKGASLFGPLLLVAGVVMTAGEVYYLSGAQVGASREILVGSCFVAVGLFLTAIGLTTARSTFGRSMTLAPWVSIVIYVLHPLFIPISRKVVEMLSLPVQCDVLIFPMTVLLALICGLILRGLVPKFNDLAFGEALIEFRSASRLVPRRFIKIMGVSAPGSA